MRLPARVVLVVAGAFLCPAALAAAEVRLAPSSAGLAVVVPATLAPGQHGETTLGPNATRATTTLDLHPRQASFPSLLLVDARMEGTARLAVRSIEGAGNVTLLALSLGGVPQVLVADGAVTQATGAPVPLTGGPLLAGVDAGRVKSHPSGATLVLDVLLARGGATLVETWTLRLA